MLTVCWLVSMSNLYFLIKRDICPTKNAGHCPTKDVGHFPTRLWDTTWCRHVTHWSMKTFYLLFQQMSQKESVPKYLVGTVELCIPKLVWEVITKSTKNIPEIYMGIFQQSLQK